MYKISVPIVWKNIERLNKDKVAATLKEMGAERVFLAFGEYIKDEEELDTVAERDTVVSADAMTEAVPAEEPEAAIED